MAERRKSPTRRRKSGRSRRKASGGAGRGRARKAGAAGRKKAARKKAGTRRKAARRSGAASARRKKAPRKAAGRKRKASRAGAGRRKKAASPAKAGAKGSRRAHRLAKDLRPTEVELRLEVDPAKGAAYRGEVTARLELDRRRRSIELHADDLRVSKARVEAGGRTQRGHVTVHPDRETIEVELDEPLPAGEATLHLAFSGRLRKDLRGLYAARSGERRYAFTQLEAADARRFFPCFDEPAMKARFALSVTTGNGNTVLSNSPVAKVEPLSDGRKTVQFERTPPLSTYLLALAVGELEASEPAWCGETEIRVWHVPGKAGLTDFALETARETLSRLERYFDLPYPYAKLDLVAVPDFEAGAMENAGAVFFRETLLLVDPATVTLTEKKRVAEVICHELAHMWYGDLVTMAWWDDLWLNEAFATWMAFHVVDAWRPEWKMWNDFQHNRAAALRLDALDHTHPIYATVRKPDDAVENFDLITYEKGAAVVRMIERFLGPKTFRAGVRTYIRRHREGNTRAADLWRALSEASGREVDPVVRAWIERPGFPVVHVRRRTGEDGRAELRLRQERFRAKPGRAASGAGERWPVPFVARVATGERRTASERHLLTRARDRMELETRQPRFVYGNADEGGFFRPQHEASELRAIAEGLEALTPVERMGLLGHQWALVRAGRAEVESFLDLALAFGKERDPDVLLTLRGPLAHLDDQVAPALGAEAVEALRARIAGAFGPALAELGWEPGEREGDETRLRRAALLSLCGEVAEERAVVEEARRRCRAYLDDRSALDANLADTVVTLAARFGDAALFDRFLAEAERARTPQERRRFLMAVGAFREPRQVDRALRLLLTDVVGTQDVALLLTRMLANRGARERAWAFLKRRWPALKRRLPPMLVTRPIEATPALGTREARRDVAAFFKANPVPTGQRAVRQALEQLDLTLAFRRRAAPGLRRWLGLGRR